MLLSLSNVVIFVGFFLEMAAVTFIRSYSASASEILFALSSSKTPPSNLTPQERKAVTSLSRDQNIPILPADEGRYTVVLNAVDYPTSFRL